MGCGSSSRRGGTENNFEALASPVHSNSQPPPMSEPVTESQVVALSVQMGRLHQIVRSLQREVEEVSSKHDHLANVVARAAQESLPPAPQHPKRSHGSRRESRRRNTEREEAMIELQVEKRRTGVSSETVRQVTNSSDYPDIPKNEEEQASLRGALEGNILFKALSDQDREIIFRAMFGVTFQAGDVIMRQGDEGDNFYVLAEGECHISLEREDETRIIPARPGDSFGELALMYDTKRAATITAVKPSRCWAIDRGSYQRILASQTRKKRDRYNQFLQRIEVLNGFDTYEREKIADVLEERTYSDGHVIVTEGEPGDSFFFVEEGTVVCSRGGENIGKLVAGDYFGELALLFKKPRAATATALGHVRVVSLEAKYFDSYLASIEDILKQNASKYEADSHLRPIAY